MNPDTPTDPSAANAAHAVAAAWQGALDELGPVIGNRGVATLFRRSVQKAAVRHPWLAPLAAGSTSELELPELRALLARQPDTEVGAAGAALFENLSVLLEGLVGSSLAQRLLRNVLTQPPGAEPAQEKST